MVHLKNTPVNAYALSTNYNYLWPSYSLPWNNFFRPLQSNPYYLQNELNNIEYREVTSPLTFKSNTQIDFADDLSPKSIALVSGFNGCDTNISTKVFVGPWFDVKTKINGVQYTYQYDGRFQYTIDDNGSLDSGLVIGLNLAVPPTFAYSNSVTGCPIDSTCSPFIVNSIYVTITIGDTTVTLANFKPAYDDVDDGNRFIILGNRIYLLLEAFSFSVDDDSFPIYYKVHFDIVEAPLAGQLPVAGLPF